MTSFWNDYIMSEMVYHLSAKQGLDKERTPELWALSEGNSRGLKKAQKCFYNASDREDAINTLRDTVTDAISDYQDGEDIIKSQDSELAAMLTEGYVQGLLRAWTLATDDPDGLGEDDQKAHEPPQDLSGLTNKELTNL
jgi:hypothetical protein